MSDVKFTQKLVEQTHPGYKTEEKDEEFSTVINNVLNAKYTTKDWATPEIENFYSNYTYKAYIDSYREHAGYDSVWYDTDEVDLAVSNNANIQVCAVNNLTTNEAPSSGIKLNLYNKTITFDLTQRVQDIHKAAMIYCFAKDKLDKMSIEEAYNSRFHTIKVEIEKYLNEMANGGKADLDLDKFLAKDEMDQCISVAKATALKKYLIEKDMLPKENGRLKYPTTYDKLIHVLPKVEAKYAKHKNKEQVREAVKKQKALIKAHIRDLRRAKFAQRKKVKEEKKKTIQDKIKSIREVNIEK